MSTRFSATAVVTAPTPVKTNKVEIESLLLKAITLMCDDNPAFKQELLATLQNDLNENAIAS